MSGLINKLTVWSWAQDWRTWLMHFLIVGLLVAGFGFLGGRWGAIAAAAYFIPYYHGREKLLEGGTYDRDRIMDAVSATVGGLLALAIMWR